MISTKFDCLEQDGATAGLAGSKQLTHTLTKEHAMKVIHVVPNIHEQASGTARSVPALCQKLAEQGVDLELHVNNGIRPPEAKYQFFAHGSWKWPPRLDISPAMHQALEERVGCANIVHNHGLWNMANIYPGWARRGKNCRFVISPRGTLSTYAWKKSGWRKRVIWHLWQHQVLRDADCLHATSKAEYSQIRNVGIQAPVAIIPNGIDIPDLPTRVLPEESRLRRLLFLGRITPVKGIDALLRVWASIMRGFPDWEVCITGPDDRGHLARMKSLSEELRVERVHFTRPVYGEDKIQAYQQAELFVLPSYSENFGMAVAESLAQGVPAVVTKAAPWSGLEEHNCGWWVGNSEGCLIECLNEAMSLPPEELAARGARGRAWMQRDFSWERIAQIMYETYVWLLAGGVCPSWVEEN